jgi:hypothetical protein
MEDEFQVERDDFEAEQRAEVDQENLMEYLEEISDRAPESEIKGCPAILVDISAKW